MLLLRKPSADQVERFLAGQRHLDFTYRDVGATATAPPTGYTVDHTRRVLGSGPALFDAACEALRGWRQFQLSWLEIQPKSTPLAVGESIAIIARTAGLWWLNACRVVYVVDENLPGLRRFGFAYGTLPAHAGTGEERFLVELDREGNVWYDILAFSRPWHPLARVGYFLMRRYQKRFGGASALAVQNAASPSGPETSELPG